MSHPSDWEKGLVKPTWPPMETEMTETEKMRGALLQALSVTQLTEESYEHDHNYETGCRDYEVVKARNLTDIADELLAHLERSGWKVVKTDPFTNRPDLMNALRDRVARIERWLDAHDGDNRYSWRNV